MYTAHRHKSEKGNVLIFYSIHSEKQNNTLHTAHRNLLTVYAHSRLILLISIMDKVKTTTGKLSTLPAQIINLLQI